MSFSLRRIVYYRTLPLSSRLLTVTINRLLSLTAWSLVAFGKGSCTVDALSLLLEQLPVCVCGRILWVVTKQKVTKQSNCSDLFDEVKSERGVICLAVTELV